MNNALSLAGVVVLSISVLFNPCIAQNSFKPDYHNYNEVTTILKDLAKKHSNLMKLDSQGKTIGGRDIWSVTISEGEHAKKPALLLVAGLEGVDLVTSEVTLLFIQSLLNAYARDDSIKHLIEKTTFYIFPRVNPDAAEAFFQSPQTERHYNSRSMDLDQDGSFDEDGYDDLNGDGFITKMRIRDAEGEWMSDEDMPELMRKANPSEGEQGMYILHGEGRDNDQDGLWNEDELGGVDFNKNFTFRYKFFVKGAGVHQISEVETRALTDFAFKHSNINIVYSFSSTENLLHPWKAGERAQRGADSQRRSARKPIYSVLANDAEYFDKIVNKFKQLTHFSGAPEAQTGHGTFVDWAYYHFCRWSFSAPAWWPPSIQQAADTSENSEVKKTEGRQRSGNDGNDPIALDRRTWTWLQNTDQTKQFIPWTEIKHPDFPNEKVEVGGFKPFIKINPPADSLQPRAAKYSSFLFYLASLIPEINLDRINVEHLHDNVYRVEAVVINSGYLPTNTYIGTRSKWNRKVKVELSLEKNHSIASGNKLTLIDLIPGSGGTNSLSWVLIGDKGSKVTISAGSPMTGEDQREIILQ
jgi:hypothetical protein